MRPVHVLAVLVALAILTAVGWSAGWFASDGPSLTASDSATPSSSTAASTPDAAAGAVDAAAPAVVDATARIAAETGPAVGRGLAIVGRVVAHGDGSPIAGAKVRCTVTRSLDPESLDGIVDTLEQADAALRVQRMQKWREGVVTVETDVDGRFRIVPPASKGQSLGLELRARGRIGDRRKVDAPIDADVDLGSLELKPSGIVSGRVVDHQQRPVRALVATQGNGANSLLGGFADLDESIVQAFGGSAGVLCDEDGRFEMIDLPPGEYSLVARHPDHPIAHSQKLQIRAGATIENVLIQLEPGATISGVVKGLPEGVTKVRVRSRTVRPTREMAGSPGPGVNIVLGGASMGFFETPAAATGVRVEKDGTFTLRGLAVGKSYTINGVQNEKGFVESSDCTERLDVPSGSVGIELHYDLGIAVTFTVVDDKTSVPIEQLVVRNDYEGGEPEGFGGFKWGGPGGSAKEFPAGKVTIANLRPKKQQLLRVSVAAIGYQGWSKASIALPARGTLDLGVVRLQSVPQLDVTVVDGKTNAPIVGATVLLRRAAEHDWQAQSTGVQQGRTDNDGRCCVNAITDGESKLAVRSDDYAPYQSEPMQLGAEASTVRTVRLFVGGTVEVHVVDDRGPKKGATVIRQSASGDHDTEETSDTGVARFVHLPAGEHGFKLKRHRGPLFEGADFSVQVVDEKGAPKTQFDASFTRVVVADGSSERIELNAGPVVSIRGVVRQNGIALEGARVAFARGSGKATNQLEVMQLAFESVSGGGEMSFGGDGGGSGRTGADGSYKIDDVEAGEHRLRITHKSRAMAVTVPVMLRAGDNVQDIDLDLAVVRGIVVDDKGQPVSKARISVRKVEKKGSESPLSTLDANLPMIFGERGRRDEGVATDAGGRFEIRGVEADCELEVTARAKDLAPASATVTVARGGTVDDVRIQLLVGGRIEVTFAAPVQFARVSARWLGDGTVRPVSQTCNGTSCALEGLQPGRWEVSVMRPTREGEQSPLPRTVEVTAGATTRAAF